MRYHFLILFLIFCTFNSEGQHKPKVLFLGNSYTAANQLPQLFTEMCNAAGDSVTAAAFSPGGQSLREHAGQGSPSVDEINSGQYDFVILQEQSQIPSFPYHQVQELYFPALKILDSVIKAANKCCKTMLYMTWGRKNGDDLNCQNWPPVCTYKGMDSLLRARTLEASDMIHSEVSPVGVAWRYMRENYPAIELYEPDGSHPAPAGSYLAATVFYTSIFKKDPRKIEYNFMLDSTTASKIQDACYQSVYLHMDEWNIGNSDPKAMYKLRMYGPYDADFINQSINADSFYWDFGDGSYSRDTNPYHLFEEGDYDIQLIVTRCGISDTIIQSHSFYPIGTDQIEIRPTTVFPNPVNGRYFKINQDCEEVYIFDLSGISLGLKFKSEYGQTEIQLDQTPTAPFVVVFKINGNWNEMQLNPE